MKFCGLMIGVMCAALPVAAWAGSQEDAQAQFAKGNELLSKGDIDGAAKAFRAAASANPENQNYRIRSTIVQRVLSMRQSLDEQKNEERWFTTAKALHAFYYENGIQNESLALATKAHTTLNTTETAVMLARSRLAIGMNSEAAEVLHGVTQAKVSPELRVLLGIALARQGQKDEAETLLKSTKDALRADSSQYAFDMARLQSLLGHNKEATNALVRCFESTPPSVLDWVKERARTSEDLKPLRDEADFTKALDTQSKVSESNCSQGTDCGKCPMRKACDGKDHKKPSTEGQDNKTSAKPSEP